MTLLDAGAARLSGKDDSVFLNIEKYECNRQNFSHTEKCGGGVGVYFVLFDCIIVLVAKRYYSSRWGSIYLDR